MSELRADARRTDDGGKPWGLWSSVGFGVLMVAVWVLVQGLLAVILVGGGARQGDVPAEGWIVARATIAGAPILVGAPVLLARMRQGISVEGYLGLVWPRAPQALRWSLVLLGFIAASDSLSWALGRPLVPESMLVVFRTAGFLPIFLFALIVAAPLAEEFLFRGFLFAGFLHSRLGPPGRSLLRRWLGPRCMSSTTGTAWRPLLLAAYSSAGSVGGLGRCGCVLCCMGS